MLKPMRAPASSASAPAVWLAAALCLAAGAAAARDAAGDGHLRLYVQPVEAAFLADPAWREAELRARLAAAEAAGDERAAEVLRGLLAPGAAPPPPSLPPPAGD